MVTNGNTVKLSNAKDVRQHMTSLFKQEAAKNRPVYSFVIQKDELYTLLYQWR
jgi:hypothetical protein